MGHQQTLLLELPSSCPRVLGLHSLECLKESRNLFGLLLGLAFTAAAATTAAAEWQPLQSRGGRRKKE
jgi:hypothetical protein